MSDEPQPQDPPVLSVVKDEDEVEEVVPVTIQISGTVVGIGGAST